MHALNLFRLILTLLFILSAAGCSSSSSDLNTQNQVPASQIEQLEVELKTLERQRDEILEVKKKEEEQDRVMDTLKKKETALQHAILNRQKLIRILHEGLPCDN